MPQTYNVADYLRAHAAERPDAVALQFPARGYSTSAPRWDAWTFAELDHHSDAYARGLTEQGVRPSDRTLLLIKPSLHFYAVLFGLFKLGAVPVLLDPGMGMKAVLACIERTAPRVVVALSAVHAVRTFVRKPFAAAELCITDGARWFWGGPRLNACHVPSDEPFAIAELGADDDAAILFTSGSTGVAKGVASKHGMFRAQVEALRTMFGFKPGDSDMQAFAAFAVFDICLGMTSVIPHMNLSKPATARPEDIVAALKHHEPNAAFASPIVWLNASRYCLEHDVELSSVRTLITVGAPIPAYLHRRYREILPEGSQVWTPYGATEGLPVAYIGTDEILTDTWAKTAAGDGTCVGRPAPGIDIRIIGVTEDPLPTWSDDLALPAGTVGEVVIGGDQVSPEYKDAPAANRAAKMDDGGRTLHRMGDLGYLDDQGRLWFCGRKAHRLETADGMVPAVPVEGVFNEHPRVFRTALVGVGPTGAEIPVLCVELEPGAEWSETIEDQLRTLASGTRHAGLVRRFLAHPSFPVDARHNSKIRREHLKTWAEQKCGDLGAAEAA